MRCPPEGICLRCQWHCVRDGETVEVRLLRTGQVCAVRLVDCWVDRLATEAGRKAHAFLLSLLEKNDDALHVWFKPGEGSTHCVIDSPELVRRAPSQSVWVAPTFWGRLFIGTEDLSEVMVRHGHAAAERSED